MRVRINNQQGIRVPVLEIRNLTKYVLVQEGINKVPVEISILLVDNARIKELNKEYLGRSRVTDVISFRMWEGPFYKLHPELLGDIVISVEQAQCQARRLHRDFKKEVWLYLIHGLLHLVGYEDDTLRNSRRMHRRSLDILRKWEKETTENTEN